MTEEFELGDRVHLSELGRSRMMRGADKHGKIIGYGRTPSVVRVQFDELEYPVSLHRSYLERDRPAQLRLARLAPSRPIQVA